MRISHPYIINCLGLIPLTIVFIGCAPEGDLVKTTPDLHRPASPSDHQVPVIGNHGGESPPAETEDAAGQSQGEVRPDSTLVLAILGNAPNPFNPATELSFAVPEGGRSVSLAIIAMDGRRARQLVVGNLPGGEHKVTWRGRDDAGRKLPSGVYFASWRSGDEIRFRELEMVQ